MRAFELFHRSSMCTFGLCGESSAGIVTESLDHGWSRFSGSGNRGLGAGRSGTCLSLFLNPPRPSPLPKLTLNFFFFLLFVFFFLFSFFSFFFSFFPDFFLSFCFLFCFLCFLPVFFSPFFFCAPFFFFPGFLRRIGSPPDPPSARPPKISLFFSLSHRKFRSFLSLWGLLGHQK